MPAPLPLVYRLAVRENVWLDRLPGELRRAIAARERRIALAPGQQLWDRGDRPDGLYRMVQGCIRLSGLSLEGSEWILDFYGPGVWFGDVGAIDGLSRIYDIHAYEASATIHHVAGKDLSELQRKHPELTGAILHLNALRLRLMLMALESYAVQTVEQRLANRLLMLASTFGEATPQGLLIRLHLPQDTLARLNGITRQRVNQILRGWDAKGKVSQHYGEILLRDQEWLEDLAAN
jgi:CRP-like cAMP-binding protein